ncbi:nascent polypeptide-associated complex subunit alpha, muscle-specific form-like [Lutra lutra]|uniref:nascent polypeptide-associated complex subunit alpha, muscle-specific form-like n=1 Tax=Lutra lutra TaxID=9657 RepID=UPI001FD1C836|nr:nascent polypeptide-associated complex subunit alpha, muscle-specific form-like [Lutra lutra]
MVALKASAVLSREHQPLQTASPSPSSHGDTCPPSGSAASQQGRPSTAAPTAAGKQRTGYPGERLWLPTPSTSSALCPAGVTRRPPGRPTLPTSTATHPQCPRACPSGHPDPADPLSRRELGRPENEGRQSRGEAGGSPAQELQDAGSGVPPRPRHSCGMRGTPADGVPTPARSPAHAPPPHEPEREAETPPGTVTAALILPPPPRASPPGSHRGHLAGAPGRGASGHGPRPRGSQSSCGSSPALPAPPPRPGRRQHRVRPSGPAPPALASPGPRRGAGGSSG